MGKMMCVTKMNSTTQNTFSVFFFHNSPGKVPHISRSKSEIPIYNIVTHMAKFWSQASTTVYQRQLQISNFNFSKEGYKIATWQIKCNKYVKSKVVGACEEFLNRRLEVKWLTN